MKPRTLSPVSLTNLLRRLPTLAHRRLDLAACSSLVILTLVAEWPLLRGGTAAGTDALTQFIPWYSFLGESLRAGVAPGWNPHQLSGTPFAGDPLSGWTYLPAMLTFTLLPLSAAAKVYLFAHPLLAGLSMYALARALRMNVAGAMVASVAYEYVGYLYVRNTCCFAFASVTAWLPLTILGAELAIRGRRWLDRGLWWGVSGLGLSQILASWLGQGSYYAMLALGGYIFYRTLVSPPDAIRGLYRRCLGFLLHGGAILVSGLSLAAAGIIPRLDYNRLSNLAGGYSGTGADAVGGWAMSDYYQLFASPGFQYIGAATLSLAIAAPLLVRRKHAAPYFAVLALAALILAGKWTTPLHSALYLLPIFESLHTHHPERAIMIFYLGAALLAGATVTALGNRGRDHPVLLVPPILVAVFMATRDAPESSTGSSESADGAGLWTAQVPYLSGNGVSLPPGPLVVLALVMGIAAACALLPRRLVVWRGLAAVSLALLLFADLYAAGLATVAEHGPYRGGNRIVDVNLGEYYSPTGATRFLRSAGEGPNRYFAYAPSDANGRQNYNPRFANPGARALEAENRATALGLQNIQGYNAVHLARYDAYLEALNRRTQNYHGANVFASGLDSPLLDLLNVRYITVPTDITRDSVASLRRLEREYPTVYANDQVKVLENRDAVPRAWIVHSARRAGPSETLELLDSGVVDPRETVLLERSPPDIQYPDDDSDDFHDSGDQASIQEYTANEIRLSASTEAPGLLVLSEVYHPSWKAYVDGQPVSLYRANHSLRAVPIPAGEHEVELRYESFSLRLGIIVSLVAGSILVAFSAAAALFPRRHRTHRGVEDELL